MGGRSSTRGTQRATSSKSRSAGSKQTPPDLAALAGTWNIISLEMEGKSYPPGGSKIVIEGDRFTSLNMGAEYSGKIVVLPETQPRSFDLHFEKGPEKGNQALGIYELSENTWKICLGLTGKKRPEKFASEPGTGHALEILERESAEEREAAEAQEKAASQDNAPAPELEGEWTMVTCLQDGEPLDPRFVKTARRVFRRNETTLFSGSRVFVKSKFTVDRSTQPPGIHYVSQRQHGIFELSGDALRTCMGAKGQPQPSDFVASKGDGRTISTWTRRSK